MDFVDRHGWGAMAPKPGITERTLDKVTAVVFHYADLVCHDDLPDEEAAVRSIQNYHMNTKGWLDIGYHFLVGMEGHVFEGRKVNQVGAHCEGFNTPSFGICFLTKDGISPAAGAAAVECVQLVEYVSLHRNVSVFGHREKTSTFCPGDKIFEWVKNVRNPGGPLH